MINRSALALKTNRVPNSRRGLLKGLAFRLVCLAWTVGVMSLVFTSVGSGLPLSPQPPPTSIDFRSGKADSQRTVKLMKRFDINILEDFTDAIAEFVLPRVEYEEIEGKKKKKNRNKVQVPPPTFVAINKIGSIEESGKGNMKPLVGKLATATATANSAPPSSNLPSKDTKELSDIKPKIDLVSTRDIPPLKKSSQPPYPPKVNSDKREFSEPLLQKSTSSIISKDNKLLENTSTQQTDPLQIYIQESDASKNTLTSNASKNTLTSNASKNTLTSNAPNNMKATSFISPLVNSDIKASYNSRNKCQTRKFT